MNHPIGLFALLPPITAPIFYSRLNDLKMLIVEQSFPPFTTTKKKKQLTVNSKLRKSSPGRLKELNLD